MSKIKACIFDLDGVIVDTAKYHYLAWKKLANELGFDFTKEDNERLKGVSRMESLRILLELGNIQVDSQKQLELAEKKNNWYREYILDMDKSEIFPGVIDFITELRKNNIKIALGSASKNAITILNQIEMVNYFDVIVDGTMVSKAKPDPDVFVKGAKRLHIPNQNCIVFEDSIAGIQAAKSADMYTVGVGSSKTLQKADFVISGLSSITVQELLKWF
ncbi:MAG: beta-phosphoglucomutase [Firmicutes bacterium]|nr:beta-phosphoglucomutase [Bacillota bacterium]